jgi:predicted transposase/invertase (TIGR01784 family)
MAQGERTGKDQSPRHDPGYKSLFSHRVMVEELLRGFVRQDWIERLDFSTLERVSNSFVSGDLRERHSDLIWRLRLTGDGGDEERWIYLYVLLEFQSTSDPFMAVRLLTYVGLLLEDIIRKERLKPGDRLPAVLPLVLHNGKRRWRAPLRLESHFGPVPKDLRRYLPRLTYLLLDERRMDLDRPELQRNVTAAFFRMETNQAPETLPGLYRDFHSLLKPGESAALQRTVHAWIVEVVHRAFPDGIMPEGMGIEEVSMLEETLIEWRDQSAREGRQEGLREGRREGRREGQLDSLRKMLLEQMTLRFGRLPAAVRRQVEEISSIQELRKLGRKVLRAKSLEEMGLG